MLIPFLFEFVIILALIIEFSNDARNIQSGNTDILYVTPMFIGTKITTLVINSKSHKLV